MGKGVVYKISIKFKDEFVPCPIYIGRTEHFNNRISAHKNKIRQSVDLFENYPDSIKYKTERRVKVGYWDFLDGYFRFRVGVDFKIGIILFRNGIRLKNIMKAGINDYLFVEILEENKTKDENGVSIEEYNNIYNYDSPRKGFNGVASYNFEAQTGINNIQIYNIKNVLKEKNFYNNSIWWNNFGLSSILQQTKLYDWTPEISIDSFLFWNGLRLELNSTFFNISMQLYNSLKKYNNKFYEGVISKEYPNENIKRNIILLKEVDIFFENNLEIYQKIIENLKKLTKEEYFLYKDELISKFWTKISF